MYTYNNSSRLRTVSQLTPDRFCDFVGEVCYFKQEYSYSGNKALMAMTDYTQHENLQYQEGDSTTNGKATILVTLWDEHLETALNLNVGVGHLLYLKNLLCKINKNGNIELIMNGLRPGRGYVPSEPIRVLDSKDPIVAELRLRQAKFKQVQNGTTGNIPKIEPSTGQSQSAVGTNPSPDLNKNKTSAIRPPPTNVSTVAATLATTISPATSETNTIKKENEPPQVPKSTSIKRNSTKTPTPVPQPRAPSLNPGSHPTHIQIEKVRQEVRNNRRNESITFLKLRVRVKDFSPKEITDFSSARCSSCSHKYPPLSDSKVPSRCPQCRKENVHVLKYYFKLTLEDEFNQIYEVHVDNSGARTLLGSGLENAANFVKCVSRFEELKVKLARIGIVPGNPKQETPLYFDCCIKLTRVSRTELTSIPASPEIDYYSSFDDVSYSGDDLSYNEQSHLTQPSENRAQKRRLSNDQSKDGKRPCRDNIESRTSKQGLFLQDSEDDSMPDFRANLVYTVIDEDEK